MPLNKMFENIFDPEVVHTELVQHMEGKVGKKLLDPTSTFALMTESIGEVASQSLQATVTLTRKVYPSLCITAEDLLRHATTDELIGLYASPSSTIMSIYMNSIDILNMGELSDTGPNSRVITMNRKTRFVVDGVTFCSVNDVRVHYDGTTSVVEQVTSYDYGFNRYGSLNSYVIDDVNGGKWIKFDIPVRQFDYQTFQTDVVGSFNARFPVIDQLWYTRVVGVYDDGEREMLVTHSDIVYDPTIPTVKVTPLEGEIRVHMPNIYALNGRAPHSILVTVYGTRGAFNMNLREFVVSDYEVDRVSKDNGLSHVTIQVISSTIVTGGRNVKTMEEIRRNIINNTTGELLSPLTFGQLQEKASRDGYEVLMYSDMVTDRLFTLNRAMDINMFMNITSNPTIYVNKTTLGRLTPDDHGHNVFYGSEGIVVKRESIMIGENDTVRPVTGIIEEQIVSTYNQVDGMEPVALSQFLKDHRLFYTPYTNIIYKDNSCRTFELHEPVLDNLTIVNRNVHTPYRINIGLYEIFHADKVSESSEDHYIIRTSLVGLTQIDTTLYRIMGQLVMTLENGTKLHFDGEGIPTLTEPNMSFKIPTDSFVDKGGKINILGGSELETASVSLRTDAYIILYLPTDITDVTEIYPDEVIIEKPTGIVDVTGLTNHKITIEFGKELEDVFNETTYYYTPRKYKTHDFDIPWFHEGTKYVPDAAGCPTDVVLHNDGDIVKDADNETVYRTRKGDVVLVNDQPVIDEVQGVVVEANLIMFELEYLISMGRANMDAILITKENIKQFLMFCKYIGGNRLESTSFQYMPKHTAASVKVLINSVEVRLPQILKPRVELYVDSNIDFILHKDVVGRVIQQQIEREHILIDDIRKALTSTLGIAAASVDLGFQLNGNVENSYAKAGTSCGVGSIEYLKVLENQFVLPKVLMSNRDVEYDIEISINYV